MCSDKQAIRDVVLRCRIFPKIDCEKPNHPTNQSKHIPLFM